MQGELTWVELASEQDVHRAGVVSVKHGDNELCLTSHEGRVGAVEDFVLIKVRRFQWGISMPAGCCVPNMRGLFTPSPVR